MFCSNYFIFFPFIMEPQEITFLSCFDIFQNGYTFEKTNASNVLLASFDRSDLGSPIEFKVTFNGLLEDKPCLISMGCHFCDGPGNI